MKKGKSNAETVEPTMPHGPHFFDYAVVFLARGSQYTWEVVGKGEDRVSAEESAREMLIKAACKKLDISSDDVTILAIGPAHFHFHF